MYAFLGYTVSLAYGACEYLGVDKRYYQPTERGYEATIREYLTKLEPDRQ